MPQKRYVIQSLDGLWLGSFYADRVEEVPGASDTSSRCVNFYQGNEIIAQVDPTLVRLIDSGGVVAA